MVPNDTPPKFDQYPSNEYYRGSLLFQLALALPCVGPILLHLHLAYFLFYT